jgi:hypothetical protein
MVASRIVTENGYKPMNNNPLHEDDRSFYATSGLTVTLVSIDHLE